MSRNHRPLLPINSSIPESNQIGTRPREISPKRPYRGAGACDRCRSKKLRCDRGRPSCSLCLKRSLTCEYGMSQNSISASQHKKSASILHKLITGPENEAIEKLRSLRGGTIPSSDLSLDQSPSNSLDRAMSPPGFSALESELTARHQNAYPYLSPVDVSNIELEAFATLVPGPIGNGAMAELNAAADMTNETSIWGPASLPTTQDDFRSLDMSYWTTIPISNELATTVITAYLAENHAMFGLFDAELFLDDLLARKLNFCSAFLVNSVFSCACLWYCTIDPSLSVLSSEFLGAAETLWLAERRSDSLLNVAAIMATGVACEIQVSNIRVLELFEDAQGMAERLGLFGVERCRRNATDWQVLSAQVKRQTAQVAWGTYNWLSRNIYYLPIKPISCPPTVPIPGEDPFQVSEKQLIGKSFGALSRLWIVVQEVAAVYSLYRPASEGALPLSFVESRYQKLLRWADTLDEDLVRGEHISNQILILHILFHCAVIDIFRPFYLRTPAQTLGSFSSPNSSATFVVRASVNQLKRILLRCYVERHSIIRIMLTGTALFHVFNQILEDFTSDSNWDIPYAGVYVSAGRGLLGMALQVGALSIDEALALATSLQSCSSRHNAAALRGDFGDFVIDFNLAAKVPEEAKVKAVATRLGEMILLNNVTQNGGFYSL
ncbi:uncharacterized protein B0J16DRAFT_373851 [Fusarium flagelliforme]|uniref:uncharacterized protein n=1 Tax=Fusarium flagelliforme TaxID=2675880 RepID=UPI001E8D3663|nr:uncharacterized protein B0J16DRAFT_373851 [Fusarium flagelliforme]KAH7183383.1 hypothetical protein B0J16DRAFT_373851 [Fusarium flagelliforme]